MVARYQTGDNFPNNAIKASPTGADYVYISDEAQSGLPSRALISNIISNSPYAPVQMPIGSALTICALPGVLGSALSDSIAQSMDLNSQIIFMPFYLTQPLTSTGFKINVQTGLVASTATLGVWATNTDYKANGAPLIQIQFATDTTGEKFVASVHSYLANTLYWVGLQLSSPITQSIISVQQNFVSGGPGNEYFGGSTYLPSVFVYTNVYSAGVMPSITPASISDIGYGYAPFILLE